MAEFYPLLFGRGFSLPQLLFFLLLLLTLVQSPSTGPQGRRRFASPWGRPAAAPTPASPGALRTALPLHPPAGFFSPPGSIAVRRAVNIYYQ